MASYRLPKKTLTCEELIRNYDYSRAIQYAARARKLGSKGPILAAWSGGNNLILNLSNFGKTDMDMAFHIWMNQFARDPNQWQNGFRSVVIRTQLTVFINKYGEDILKIITSSAVTT